MEPAGRRQPPGRRSPLTAAAAPSSSRQRVLICDDEPNTVRLIRRLFEERGFEVATAYDRREGLQKVYEFKPNLLILDVMMPHVDGFEMLREIRQDPSLESIYVIMLSAKAQDKDVFEGYHYGADTYLTKPFNPIELLPCFGG